MWSKYVAEKIERIPVVTKFLECFRSTAPGPARPVRTVVTPNDSERGPPETEEDKKVNALRDEISKRFKKHLEKQKNNYFTSCDPHHDMYTFSYWQILRHSI